MAEPLLKAADDLLGYIQNKTTDLKDSAHPTKLGETADDTKKERSFPPL